MYVCMYEREDDISEWYNNITYIYYVKYFVTQQYTSDNTSNVCVCMRVRVCPEEYTCVHKSHKNLKTEYKK